MTLLTSANPKSISLPFHHEFFYIFLTFNCYISNIDITSYADDNTVYIAANIYILQLFDNSLLKNNPDKCHLLKTIKI